MTPLRRGVKAMWLKTGLVVIGLYVVVIVCPDRTVDSWQIFNPKKVALMVFALALIQALGVMSFDIRLRSWSYWR